MDTKDALRNLGIILKRSGILKPFPPQVACVYAFDMSNDTIKIGMSTNPDNRQKQVAGTVYLDVKRVHHTGWATRSFIYKVERRCQAAFADRRIRGEYFDITFEAACSELDKYNDEIAAALAEADQCYIAELDYYYNEFLPEYEEQQCKLSTSAEPIATLTSQISKIGAQVADITLACKKLTATFNRDTAVQLAEIQRADKLIASADRLNDSPERNQLYLQAANLINGKRLF